ncbi:MAG: serine hydrolase domain-containing protein [Dermatophilaceae bacterium]|nr:beta-lactamase family protein [Intrasporangiaceae bacterium]
MTTDEWQAIGDEAARLEDEQGFSGILRATRGEEVLWESCHGMANRADRIPVRPQTRFGTASLSKMFTAIGVLDAAGRGELALDDAIVDLLPGGKRPSTLRPDVTVHHLLSHTSGIADYFEEDEDLPGYREDYGALWDELPTYRVRDYATLLRFFADLPPICPPGTAYHYSNAGYVLLGILLAEVSGVPFAEAVETRVFEPAGMVASGYLAMDEAHPDVAQGYLRPLTPGEPWRTNIFSVPAVGGGDGGAMVTAEDVERFVRAVQRGGVWQGVTPGLVLTRWATSNERWSAGYGVNIRYDGVFGKGGGDPGVATVGRYAPATDVTAVLLANVDWDETAGLYELAERFLQTAIPG